MREKFFELFPLRQNCFDEEGRDLFYVKDPLDGPCFIIRDDVSEKRSRKYFKVSNPSQKQINFIAIDKCLLTEGSQCDFILFDSNKLLLVEMKMEMVTEREENADDVREEAIAQLKSTLDSLGECFVLKNVQFPLKSNIKMLVSTPTGVPKTRAGILYLRERCFESTGVYFDDANQFEFR